MEQKKNPAENFLAGLMDDSPMDTSRGYSKGSINGKEEKRSEGKFRVNSKENSRVYPKERFTSSPKSYPRLNPLSFKDQEIDQSGNPFAKGRNQFDRYSFEMRKSPPDVLDEKIDDVSPKARRAAKNLLKRRNQHNRLLNVVFSMVIVVFIVLHLVSTDRTYSEAENRNLAAAPAFSKEALLEGSYFSGLDSYIADQFFARDSWMSWKLKEDILLGRKEAGGVYLGRDGYLLSQPAIPNENAILRTAKSINAFAAQHPDLSMVVMVAPGISAVQPQYLPEDVPIRDQQKDIQLIYDQLSAQIKLVDVTDALRDHAEEYIYYKTDHHWTTRGAFYGFCAAAGKLGLPNARTNQKDYQIYPVAADFQGTLSSKSGSHQAYDIVDIYLMKDQAPSYYVNYVDSGRKVASFYQSEALESKDKYTVFFGGNHPLLTIKTTADNERGLLVFKDSYANSFIPFLYPYFEDIVVIDPRYYYENLAGLMNNYGITDVLFLYSADTLVTDTALADVLGVE